LGWGIYHTLLSCANCVLQFKAAVLLPGYRKVKDLERAHHGTRILQAQTTKLGTFVHPISPHHTNSLQGLKRRKRQERARYGCRGSIIRTFFPSLNRRMTIRGHSGHHAHCLFSFLFPLLLSCIYPGNCLQDSGMFKRRTSSLPNKQNVHLTVCRWQRNERRQRRRPLVVVT